MNAGSLLAGPVLTGVAFLMMGCSREPVSAASSVIPATTVEFAPDPNVVTVANPDRFSVARAVVRREPDRILANGVVAADVSRTYPVSALSSGRVVDIRARLGDDVQKGQLLLTMSSPDMSMAISDYQKFKASEALTKAQLDRAQLLYSHGATAHKELELAEDTYYKAKIDAQTADEHIRILGGDPQHLSSLIDIHAPVAGTIIE
jgi:membrane fusion protein, heavy metal efflux system